MIVGCQNVGKTSLKKRLVGIGDDQENRKAHSMVLQEKTEQEMT